MTLEREVDHFIAALKKEWDRELAALVPDPAEGVPAHVVERLRARQLEIIDTFIERLVERIEPVYPGAGEVIRAHLEPLRMSIRGLH